LLTLFTPPHHFSPSAPLYRFHDFPTFLSQSPDAVAAEALAAHADTAEAAPVPQIITPLPAPVDAPLDGTPTPRGADEVAAVLANEEKEKKEAATESSTADATTAVPETAALAPATEEAVKGEDSLKTSEAPKSPKRSSSPFQAVKGFFGRNPSHKSGKVEVCESLCV
jgi:hypothetical protein